MKCRCRERVHGRGQRECTDTLLERVWTWLHQTFPERQIYIRSDGRVQFFTFGPSLQATLAGLVLIFLGWVAFATVNVVFKDRIIAAKDHRFQQMQSAYENRLADLQISYDELNGALVGAEDKFKSTADALQPSRTPSPASSIARARSKPRSASAAPDDSPATSGSGRRADQGVAADSVGFTGAAMPPDSEDDPDSSLTVMPGPAVPQPRTAKTTKTEHAGQAPRSSLRQFASRPVRPPRRRRQSQLCAAYAQHPGLQALADQTARVATLGSQRNRPDGPDRRCAGRRCRPAALGGEAHRHQSRPVPAQSRRRRRHGRSGNSAGPGACRRHRRSGIRPGLSARRRGAGRT